MVLIKGLSLNWPKHLTVWIWPLGAKTCEDASSRASSSCGVSVEARKNMEPGWPLSTKSQVQSNKQMLVKSHKREAIANLA